MRVLLLVAMVLALSAIPARAIERKAVDAAVDRGVTALRKMQRPDGTWDFPDIGATALAGLTLVECGVAKSDKAVTAAASRVRQTSLTLTHTYSLALSVLFLDSLGEPSDTPLIESMIVRLLAGQTRMGAWSYNCPSISLQESRRLQTEAGGRVINAGRDLAKLPTPGKRTIKDLAPEIRAQLQVIAGGGVGGAAGGGDNSNTQFAILGLWVGRRYGVPTQPALIKTYHYFQFSQAPNGTWGYTAPADLGLPGMMMNGSTPTMTCAGILGLAFGHGSILDGKKKKDPKAKTLDISSDVKIKAALRALTGAVGSPVGWDGNGNRPAAVAPIAGKGYYYLWSLERVSVALKLETIGKKNWYDWGAEILLANQGFDGSWRGDHAASGADTCFALLFLKRANFTRDLSSGLAGLKDPGKVLRAGGVGGDALRTTSSNLGEVGIGKKPKPDDKKPTASSGTNNKPYEKTTPRTAEENAARLSADLMKSSAENRGAILNKMRDTRGVAFTEALVTSISRLDGDARKEARIALAERLTRMKPATLREYLDDDEAEIRRAAALATAAKNNRAHVPDLIRHLDDKESLVRRSAHHALKKLTGKDFGPDEEATVSQRKKAITAWRKWWQTQSRE